MVYLKLTQYCKSTIFQLEKKPAKNFPGPVGKTLHSQCGDEGFDPSFLVRHAATKTQCS